MLAEKNEAVRLLEKIVNTEILSDTKVNKILGVIDILKTPINRKKRQKNEVLTNL